MKVDIKFSTCILAMILVGLSAAAFLLAGPHLPDATMHYYLTKSEIGFTVVRSVRCDAQNNLVIVDSITPKVAHLADREQPQKIPLSGLKGKFSDTEVKFEFYEDGRLRGVNSSSTGQGDSIFKSVVKVASAASLATKSLQRSVSRDSCSYIKKIGGGQPLTITYQGKIDLDDAVAKKQKIEPADVASRSYAQKLADSIGSVYVVVEGKHGFPKAPVVCKTQTRGGYLKARQPGFAKIKVMVVGFHGGDYPLWEGELPVAQFGTEYSIPIPACAYFGKLVFSAQFLESGALASLQYAKNNGSAQAVNVIGATLIPSQDENAANLNP